MYLYEELGGLYVITKGCGLCPRSRFGHGGLKMRAGNLIDPRTGAGGPKPTADIYEFRLRQPDSNHRQRIKALEGENELLRRTISELQIELVRLGNLLGR